MIWYGMLVVFFPYSSSPIYNRCTPNFFINTTAIVINEINNFNITNLVIASLYDSWYVIVGGIVASILLGFGWLLLMRYISGVAIWTNVISSILFLAAVGVMMYMTAGQIQNKYDSTPETERLSSDLTNIQFLEVLSYILWSISGILFIATVFNAANIQLAISISQETSRAFLSMPSLLFFPLIPLIKLVILIVFFVIICIYLASVSLQTGSYDENGNFLGYAPDNTLKAMICIHVFVFLWSLNVIIGINQTVIAGAIADWYYSIRGRNLKSWPVARAYSRTMRYSFGSVAFGALIIAIVQLIRILFKYLKSNIKGKENACAQCLFKCLSCCLACFERFLEFLNKNAYIMIAIYGYPFCVSAKRAFSVVLSNPLKAATLQCISSFCMLLGKISISALVTGGCFIFIKNTALTSVWVIPVVVIAISSYSIASLFMNVYDMAIQAVLLCFLEDISTNDGSKDRPYHCSKTLYALIEKSDKSNCCCC